MCVSIDRGVIIVGSGRRWPDSAREGELNLNCCGRPTKLVQVTEVNLFAAGGYIRRVWKQDR